MEFEKEKKKLPILALITPLFVGLAAVGGWYVGQMNVDKAVKEETTKCTKQLESAKADSSKEAAGLNQESITNTQENTQSTTNTQENTQSTTGSQEVIQSSSTEEKARCYGTYYVNGDANEGKYILTEDGKYNVEGKEIFGVFVIHENTITFIVRKHTTGPVDKDPFYYNPKSYLISDDCSMITLTEPGSHVAAGLVKQD